MAKRKRAQSTAAKKAKKTDDNPHSSSSKRSSLSEAGISSALPRGGRGQKNPLIGIEELGNPVIKSPLDTHGYKMVRLPENGLKGLLVSTCLHPTDIGNHLDSRKKSPKDITNCAFDKISEFNEKYAHFKTKIPEDHREGSRSSRGNVSQGEDKTYNFAKATEKQQKDSESKRNANIRKPKQKIKCRKGVHEQDDEMQSFCNGKVICVMYVKAGFFQDPKDKPGMAHFCEHAVSLGSTNYPEPEQFTKFVEYNGGLSNARTEHECTVFYFYVNYEEITAALDMFVDMFANPIFHTNELRKEIENVNSEFEIKKLLDDLRLRSLLESCIPEGHPANNFGMGRKDTLMDKDITNRLKEWFNQYYFGENMVFAIQGPLSLPQLEKLFADNCSKIPGRSETSVIARPLSLVGAAEVPFDMEKWNRFYHMDIEGPTTFMTISWPLDPKFGKNYATKPVHYFSYIFSYKGQGSLDWFLKQKGWITSLFLNTPESSFYATEYYTIFSIYMELTSDGLDHRMEILIAVLNYINLLQQKKPSVEIFNELQQLQADIFHYRSDMNLSDPTFGRKFEDRHVNDTLASLLHVISKTNKPEEILLSAFLLTKYSPTVLNDFIKALDPARMMVVVGAKCFAEHAIEREKWYQTKYFTKQISAEFVDLVKKMPLYKELSFPKQNPFTAVSFCYPDKMERTKEEKMEKRNDLLVYESAKGRLTYGNSKCQKGILPSAQYVIDFGSPALEDDSDLSYTPYSDVFLSLLKFILDAELGAALCSLISYEVEPYNGFIRVTLCGPSPKLPALAQKILATVENIDQYAEQFQNTTKDLKRTQINNYKDIMNNLETCANQLLGYLVNQRSLFMSDFVCMLEESLDHEEFMSFVHDFKRKLYFSGDLNGCVSKRHATVVAECLDKFKCKPYKKKMEHEAVDRAIELPLGERCLLVSAKNKENRSILVMNYYQMGDTIDEEQAIMINAISSYLSEIAFQELRTNKSLGYIADASKKIIRGIYGLTVCVQGAADTHTCGYINEAIDEFMEIAFENCLSTPSKFKNNVEAFFPEGIKLSHKATQNFYRDHLLPKGEKFRKLSIQIQGHQKRTSSPLQPSKVARKVEQYSSGVKLQRCSEGSTCGLSRYSTYLDLCLKGVHEENGYYITDAQKFKNDRPCFPNLEYVDLTGDLDE